MIEKISFLLQLSFLILGGASMALAIRDHNGSAIMGWCCAIVWCFSLIIIDKEESK